MAQRQESASERYAIHEASREGRLQIVESLLSANPKLVNRRDEDERLPLHWAVSYNHLEVVNVLINAVAAINRAFDPDVQDASGWTPLMMASSLKNDEGLGLVRLLLGKEADVKATTTTGGTALHFATSKANLEVCRALLDAGASARVKDRRGQLPLHRAAAAGNVPLVKLLLGQGKSPVNATDADGMTALHHAVSEGHGDVAVELMKAGAETDKKDKDGSLAIDLAPDSKVRSYIVSAAEREGIDLVSGE